MREIIWFICLPLMVVWNNLLWAEALPATCDEGCPAPYVENRFWTTEYGPAAADIVLAPSNFLRCSSDAYALCYYSGPESAPTNGQGEALPSLPCTLSDQGLANCRCYAESGTSYVTIHSIRNTEAYIETIRACGMNGEKCANMASEAIANAAQALGQTVSPLPSAPVCDYLQTKSDGGVPMAPQAELISTYSFAKAKEYGVQQTDCTSEPTPYAGCMTASCTFERDNAGQPTGFANCECPLYKGPFQVGQGSVNCDAGEGHVWSAAYAPE